MILSVFLAIGESWEDFKLKGQDQLLLKNNFYYYSINFEKTYIFSYGKKSLKLYKNVFLLGNRYNIHRFLYTFIYPLIYKKEIKESHIIRGMQITGGIAGIISKLLYNKKVFINYGYNYSQFDWIEKKYFHSLIFKLLERIVIRLVDGIIITNKLLKIRLSKITNTPLILIPNGVNVEVFKPVKVKKDISLLFIGRLELQKNLTNLLQAISLLNNKKKINIFFIGEGKQKLNLLNIAKKYELNLTILPPKPHDKLNKFYNRAKIFILPSYIEGHPKVLLEAMSCQLPVIGTNVEGIKEIIKNRINGLLSETDPLSLSIKISELISDKQLQNKLGRNARITINKKYSLEETFNKEVILLKRSAI